ncbi:MAG: NAD-dependent epimerase/dehydratase family protein, partial [Deltaproteobacteria bacterium]
MTVLVTGATGFLGGRLAEVLKERGERVRLLVRREGALDGRGYEVARGCLEDRDSLRRAVEGAHIVYHCAGLASDWAPWSEFLAVNVTGVRNLVDAAAEAGCVQRFVHVSTTDVYGYPRRPCDESYGFHDVGLPYNRSKGLGEQEVWRVHRQIGLPVTVVRPASIYG